MWHSAYPLGGSLGRFVTAGESSPRPFPHSLYNKNGKGDRNSNAVVPKHIQTPISESEGCSFSLKAAQRNDNSRSSRGMFHTALETTPQRGRRMEEFGQ